jgi:hypothetical protein
MRGQLLLGEPGNHAVAESAPGQCGDWELCDDQKGTATNSERRRCPLGTTTDGTQARCFRNHVRLLASNTSIINAIDNDWIVDAAGFDLHVTLLIVAGTRRAGPLSTELGPLALGDMNMSRINLNAAFFSLLLLSGCADIKVPNDFTFKTPDAPKVDIMRNDAIRKDQQIIASLQAKIVEITGQAADHANPLTDGIVGTYKFNGSKDQICTVEHIRGNDFLFLSPAVNYKIKFTWNPKEKMLVGTNAVKAFYFKDKGLLAFDNTAIWRK